MSGDRFAIAERCVGGVTQRYWAAAPRSLREVWAASREHGDRPYLVYEDERYTYAEAHRIVAALAGTLARRFGLGRGDRFAVALRNYPEWVFSFWAGAVLGAVAVPLNAWWSGEELAFGLDDSGAGVLIADGERLDRLGPELASRPGIGVVSVRADAGPGGSIRFEDAVAAGGGPVPEVSIDPDDDAVILYTSGTTGRPKGAVATQRNLTNALLNAEYLTRPRPGGDGSPRPPRATLLSFPLFHVAGLVSHLLPFTARGDKLVLLYRWDADRAVDLIDRERVTALSGVVTTTMELLERAAARGVDLTSLKSMAAGASSVPAEFVRRVDEQFTAKVSPGNGYGLTETCGAMVGIAGAAYRDRPTSVGRPLSPLNEVRVAGESGEPLGPGEVGEIWLKGPTVVRGYLNDDEATAASFTDGWFHTGDLGTVDTDGYVYVVDRLKDVVIRGGENVYAAEVESVLFEHPDVVDAAVVGAPHPRLGEEVAAFVCLRPGAAPTADDLRRHASARLARFKVPSVVVFRDGPLPRNAAGKVLKRVLREELRAPAGSRR
ncbi:MAG TPA: class I adenylate-forming enzyme family protein [Acidimicrobiia bacterium]|nr:class I adenylate-forming enzyme family protein [Acidimicrobiia bacterium]